MRVPPDLSSEFVCRLQRVLDEAPPHGVVAVLRRALGDAFGVKETTLLLADYAEMQLERFEPDATIGSGPGAVPIDGTNAGRAYSLQEAVVDVAGPGWSGFFPVSVRAERFGVLEVVFPEAPEPGVTVVLELVAQTVGYIIASARRYTDVFERVRRRRNLALAAEMQWELLPVLGYETAEFSLAGALEPAYEVAGDNFDYAVEPDHLTLSLTDAMGHGLRAAMLASLAVNAMRNSRRGGGHLAEQAAAAAGVIDEQFGGGHFVTGLLMRYELGTGRGEAVNAGQGLAWRQRNGGFDAVPLSADVPMGPFPQTAYRLQPVTLDPGDRLVILSDGVLDAGPRRGAEGFGLPRLRGVLVAARDESPLQCVRRVISAVVEHQAGRLADDATILCLDWRGRR